MLLFKDFKSGDEMFTDVFKFKEFDDLYYEIDGKLQTETTAIDDSLIGGNKSEENPGMDDAEAGVQSGVNIVLQNRLKETNFSKKTYKAHIKEFIGALIKHVQENHPEIDLTEYKKKLQKFVAEKILANFDDWQFFIGESGDNDGLVAYLDWRGETPYMIFLKHALIEEKA